MGLFSSSKKKTSTFNTSQTGEVDTSTGIGARDTASLGVSNVTGGASLTVNDSGLSATDAAELVNAVTGANSDFLKTSAEAINASAPADIARSVTGTESEVGRVLNQSALPILLLVGAFLFINRR